MPEECFSLMSVLLVDDYAPFRKWLSSELRIEGFELLSEACDGIEAVQIAKEIQPNLILMDIGLPRLNGIEAAWQIEEVSPSSKILFVSSLSSTEIVEEALSFATSSFLSKFDVAREFRAALHAVLRGERYVSSSAGIPNGS